jgi:hypothetical protein
MRKQQPPLLVLIFNSIKYVAVPSECIHNPPQIPPLRLRSGRERPKNCRIPSRPIQARLQQQPRRKRQQLRGCQIRIRAIPAVTGEAALTLRRVVEPHLFDGAVDEGAGKTGRPLGVGEGIVVG